MTDKTQPTAHAEITAPISADLRGMPGVSEQDAELLEQAASMLEGLQNDERNRGNCSTAEGAACSADAVRRLAVQLLRSTETAQCLHQGAEPDKHMTIGRALREGLRAEPWISGGPGAAACVGLCAIQLQGWWHSAETAKAYADAYNRGADNMRAALQAVAVPEGFALVPLASTAAMEFAFRRAEVTYRDGAGRRQPMEPHSEFKARYREMLAAAPQPPAAQEIPSGVLDAIRAAGMQLLKGFDGFKLETASTASASNATSAAQERWIFLLCKSGTPGRHGLMDHTMTPCPNEAIESARGIKATP